MLFRPKSKFIFCNSLFENQFEILPKKLSEFFCVSTPVGESILAERVYHDCTISINYKDTIADLVELAMVDLDIIQGMNWLYACYASVDSRTQLVKF